MGIVGCGLFYPDSYPDSHSEAKHRMEIWSNSDDRHPLRYNPGQQSLQDDLDEIRVSDIQVFLFQPKGRNEGQFVGFACSQFGSICPSLNYGPEFRS